VTAPVAGTRVAVVGGQGGLAEMGVFPAAACIAVPEGMPDTVAAGFQVAYGTSHLALTRRARLKATETLVVPGAAGGVGLAAVEVAKALGARVIAVARGEEKLGIARAAGADHVIDAGADLKAEIRALGGAMWYMTLWAGRRSRRRWGHATARRAYWSSVLPAARCNRCQPISCW
jgi:NADPH:quinone reductase